VVVVHPLPFWWKVAGGRWLFTLYDDPKVRLDGLASALGTPLTVSKQGGT
jgi:hypothetical protein